MSALALATRIPLSFPSPSSNAIHIGPLQLRAYGLMIALGVIAAVWLFGRRLEQSGAGKREDAAAVSLWAVPAGVIGARLYHVATDWYRFEGRWFDVVKVWQGGLGIWGGVLLGVPAGLWACRRRGISISGALTAATPSLPLAQAIGRIGNYFNQELFGKPTDLPWAVEITKRSAIPDKFQQYTTFHPTFLYESLWNFLLCAALIWLGRRYVRRPGRLFAWYVAGYTFIRYFMERLRIDDATKVGGLRINEIVSILVFLAAVAYIVIDARVAARRPQVASAGDPPVAADESAGGEAAADESAEGEAAADESAEGEAAADDESAEGDELAASAGEGVDEEQHAEDDEGDRRADPDRPLR